MERRQNIENTKSMVSLGEIFLQKTPNCSLSKNKLRKA